MAVPDSSMPDARVSPMFSYCASNVTGSNGPEADQILEMICVVGQLDSGAIAGKALFDAEIEPARPLGLQIRIAEEARRRAVRLDEQRLLDAASDASTEACGAERAGAGGDYPRHRKARRRIKAEAAVAFEPDAADERRAFARRLVLDGGSSVVALGPLGCCRRSMIRQHSALSVIRERRGQRLVPCHHCVSAILDVVALELGFRIVGIDGKIRRPIGDDRRFVDRYFVMMYE